MTKKFIPLFFAFLMAGCQITPNSNKSTSQILLSNSQITLITPSPTIIKDTQTNMSTPSSEISQTTAIMKTSLGDITLELYPKSAPKTVANFVGLSKGTIDWTDPKTGQKVSGKSLYAGTIFHRVIEDFMIQGGDPKGTGMGGPGYQFQDEFDSSLTFSEPYILAMANSGPGTNGSQFFITVAPTPWLNNHHTIFGKVIKGQEVVDAIVSTPTSAGDKPVTDVIIKGIEVVEN